MCTTAPLFARKQLLHFYCTFWRHVVKKRLTRGTERQYIVSWQSTAEAHWSLRLYENMRCNHLQCIVETKPTVYVTSRFIVIFCTQLISFRNIEFNLFQTYLITISNILDYIWYVFRRSRLIFLRHEVHQLFMNVIVFN